MRKNYKDLCVTSHWQLQARGEAAEAVIKGCSPSITHLAGTDNVVAAHAHRPKRHLIDPV